MAIPQQFLNAGVYLPTTYPFPGEDKQQFILRLYQTLNSIILALNLKETGQYLQEEFVTSNMWFNLTNNYSQRQRNTYRLSLSIGSLPPGTKTTAHGLTIGSTWTFVDIYGAASFYSTTPANSRYYPLPYADPAGDIVLKVDGTNVTIINNTAITFSACYVVLEYLKI